MNGREVVGLILLVGGIALFLGAAAVYALARATARWASVEGRITSSRLNRDVTLDGGGRSTTYRLYVAYEYEVGGRKLVGKRRQVGESMFGWMNSAQAARRLQEEYPEGRAVTVHYDPAHPERCTLSREVDHVRFRRLLAVAAIFAAAGVGVFAGVVKVQ